MDPIRKSLVAQGSGCQFGHTRSQGELLRDALAIADELINDPDDLVQKGVGWLLKVQSQSHEEVVFDYVMDHKDKMPRTMLRYAIEQMP